MSIDSLSSAAIEKIKQLKERPVAIEAYWDGDTRGWFLVLVAILDGSSRWHPKYTEYDIVILRHEETIHLFDNNIPPLPEAEVGSILSKTAG